MIINLKYNEHYFTASKYKGGFFTLDNSPSLSNDEIKELEKKGQYVLPINSPNSPSVDQIENLFPVNIAFYKLKSSGKIVYLQSTYTGSANHTPDRPNNFFSDSIILECDSITFPAVYIYDNFNFKKQLNISEDENYTPGLTDNKTLSFEFSNHWKQIYFRRFQSFINNDLNKQNTLGKIIDAIVEGWLATPGRNITICDKKDNINEWVLLLNFLLPLKLINNLSFASYVSDPRKENYPFSITCIVPECDISSLPKEYFKLYDVSVNDNYEVSQKYTKYLIEILNKNPEEAYGLWEKLNENIDTLDINELNNKLNTPVLLDEYYKNLKQETDFYKLKIILALELSQETNKLIISNTISENPQLVLELLKDKLNSKIPLLNNFNEKISYFNETYKEYFEPYKEFRETQLMQYVEGFRDILKDEEKCAASYYSLKNFDLDNLQQQDWIDEKLLDVDYYLERVQYEIENKIDIVSFLDKKLKLDKIKNNIPQIMKLRTYDDIRKAAIKDGFIKKVGSYKEFLLSISDKDKIELFMIAFNNDAYFYKGVFQDDFHNYITTIKQHLSEKEAEFWYLFFDKNQSFNKDNNPKKHSLDYLKKKFVSLLFRKHSENYRLIEKLDLNDTYIIRWIEEDIREHTTSEAVLETFAEYFKEFNTVKKSSFWSKFLK